MPSIQDAMVRSLQSGLFELVRRQQDYNLDDAAAAAGDAAGAANDVQDTANDVQGTITDVKTAFSSWDNCMQATFCKWPVIAIIVVGGIIIFSVIWCIIRCACCGLSCCCSCFSCLKCCGNCCGCCDPPRNRKGAKYLDEPYIPPDQGYTSHPPMTTGTSPFHPAQKSAPPQYAEFDVSKKGGDDALPEMPSWESAASKKILVEEEGVEMDQLKKSPTANASQSNVALMAGASGSAGPPSPVSPTHRQQFPPQAGPNPYGGNSMGSTNNDPYAAGGQGNHNRGPSPYGQRQQPQDQYGMGGAGGPGPGRQSPYGNNGYPQQQRSMDSYGRASPHAQDPYVQQQQPTNPLDMGFQRSASPQNYNNGYDRQSPGMGRLSPSGRPSPSPQQGMRPPPRPQQGGSYGYDQGSYSSGNNSGYGNGSYSNDGGYGSQQGGQGQQQGRQYPPGPQRSYTGDSQWQMPPPQRQYTGGSSPGRSPQGQGQASGFDFSNSGYSRPPQPQRTGTGESYPGRRAYQPQQQGW